MATANPDPLGLVGRTVDKYDIVSLAGEGGFSVVYRAEHRIWKQPVAIKFFTLLEEAKPELRERLLEDFMREGKLLSELSSRTAAILQARDIGRLERSGDRWIPFMVLEWLDGRSLESWLEELRQTAGPAFDLGSAIGLLGPAVQALEVAHSKGIAHRDLKPANLMVLGDWRSPGAMIKVLDFGIAKVMAEQTDLQQQLQLTGAQLSAFTPGYGAPEQFSRGHGATGPWTDVYAMALIVLELLRGGEPVLQGETVYEVGRASCSPDARPTPRRLGLAVSDAVEQLFARALALRPSDRFATMGQFWAELRAVAELPAPRSSAAGGSERGATAPMQDASSASRPGPARPARSIVTPDGPTVAAMLTSVPTAAPPASRTRLSLWAALLGAIGLGGLLLATAGGGADDRASANLPEFASASSAGPPAAATEPHAADAAADREPEPPRDAGVEASARPAASARNAGAEGVGSRVPARQASPDGGRVGPTPAAVPTLDPWDARSFGGRR